MRRMRASVWITVALVSVLCGCTLDNTAVVPGPTGTPNQRNACPVWTNPPAAVNIPLPGQQTIDALASYDAQILLRTPRPIFNPYTTTLAPIGHLAKPVSCLTRTSARNESVGREQAFWIVNNDSGDYSQIQARLVYVTPHLYMYVQDNVSADIGAIKSSANLFEHQIFRTDEATYGPHWSPGVDDDPHITVLNATGLGNYIGGYFSISDEFPKALDPYSNERQMIYINLDAGIVPGDEYYNATLAHEFQHMIHWYWHPADGSWINEGMSVLAEHLNRFAVGRVDDSLLAQPDTQLTSWAPNGPATLPHYGAGYLFADYFAEHYGGDSVLRELLADPAQVPLNFDDVLAKHGYKDRFDDVFAKWVIANLLNDPTVDGGMYAYPSIPDKQATVQTTVSTFPFVAGSARYPATVHQYGTEYYTFQPPTGVHALTIGFTGTPYISILNTQPYGGARFAWWSNAGSEMDSTLTRTFDLTRLAGKSVTLTFRAWYDLSGSAAYAEISSDGGKHWTVPTVNVASGGDICCGFSEHSGDGLTATWESDSVDLSAYAGKTIQIRFEQVSRTNVPPPGLALDDIEIPQLGFKDDVSSDNGWQAAGFVRTANVLPEHYVLQAVVYPTGGGTPQVLPVTVDPRTAKGSITISSFGQLDHVTLAVSAMTPTLTALAPYLLTAHVS